MKFECLTTDKKDVLIEIGVYPQSSLGASTFIKVTAGEKEIDFDCFNNYAAKGLDIRQSQLAFAPHLILGVKDSISLSKFIKSATNPLEMKEIVKNPTQMKKGFLDVFDADMCALLSKFVYFMRSSEHEKFVFGDEAYLNHEELWFVEKCLKESPYLKSKQEEVIASEVFVAFKNCYSLVLKSRMKQFDLPTDIAKFLKSYDDNPINLEQDENLPL